MGRGLRMRADLLESFCNASRYFRVVLKLAEPDPLTLIWLANGGADPSLLRRRLKAILPSEEANPAPSMTKPFRLLACWASSSRDFLASADSTALPVLK